MNEELQMNPLQTAPVAENQQSSRKPILFLVLGILAGAVLMWFLFPFISPSYLSEAERTELLEQHGVALLESFEAQKLEGRKLVMGTVRSIDAENSILLLDVNKGNSLILVDDEEEDNPVPGLVETKVSVAVGISEETKIYKSNQELNISQQGDSFDQENPKVPASLEDIQVDSRVTIISSSPVENLNVGVKNYVYAAEIFIF